jgi:putative SOS response-associated peptidase YedK
MCGRATLTTPADSIAEVFGTHVIEIGPPRFNLAPTQPLLTVRKESEAAARELHLVRWGLVPWWAKPEEWKKVSAKCIQARAEGVRKAPAFRDAFKRHRCLVVVDGFFEWKGEGKARAPFLAQRPGKEPFAIAGLWDSWKGPDGRIESASVLTTRAEGPIRAIHDRMPLVLAPSEWDTWLAGPEDAAAELLKQPTEVLAAKGSELVVVPVSKWVNDPKHDDPKCLAPPDED